MILDILSLLKGIQKRHGFPTRPDAEMIVQLGGSGYDAGHTIPETAEPFTVEGFAKIRALSRHGLERNFLIHDDIFRRAPGTGIRILAAPFSL